MYGHAMNTHCQLKPHMHVLDLVHV